jgi:hypothetical protein
MLFSGGGCIIRSDILSLDNIYIPLCYVLKRPFCLVHPSPKPLDTLAAVSIVGTAVHVGYHRTGRSSPFLDRSLS